MTSDEIRDSDHHLSGTQRAQRARKRRAWEAEVLRHDVSNASQHGHLPEWHRCFGAYTRHMYFPRKRVWVLICIFSICTLISAFDQIYFMHPNNMETRQTKFVGWDQPRESGRLSQAHGRAESPQCDGAWTAAWPPGVRSNETMRCCESINKLSRKNNLHFTSSQETSKIVMFLQKSVYRGHQ